MSNLIKIAVDAMGGDNSPIKLLMVLFITINSDKTNFYKILVIKKKFKIH